MKIQMHDREVELLSRFLSETTNYFEYGVGGSTCLAAGLVKGRIRGVDSDPRWIEDVRVATGPDPRIDLRHVDIGATGGWGTPVSRAEAHKFPAYSESIRQFATESFDFCLVDGRSRVACFLEALEMVSEDAVLAMHDYAARPGYHVVEPFARRIATCQQLTLFVKRPDRDRDHLWSVREAHRLNWA